MSRGRSFDAEYPRNETSVILPSGRTPGSRRRVCGTKPRSSCRQAGPPAADVGSVVKLFFFKSIRWPPGVLPSGRMTGGWGLGLVMSSA